MIQHMLTEISEAQDIQHEQMMAVSDYYCRECDEYFMLENMALVQEPHGEYTVACPYDHAHELETES